MRNGASTGKSIDTCNCEVKRMVSSARYLLPLKAIHVMVGLLSKYVDAMRTTAEVDVLSGKLFLHCQMPRFLR